MSSNTPGANAHELDAFIGVAKEHRLDDETLVGLLRKNGWSERRVYGALSAYYADILHTPIPKRGGSGENARDAFFYLLNFITLASWTTALGRIGYTLIARAFPDPAVSVAYAQPLRTEIAWQLAAVIVTFPIFAYVHRTIARQLRLRPDLYESGVRKWLTYVALVVAALVVICDGVWFLSAFLLGQLTVSFFLDSLVLLVLGGGVFGYYLTTIDGPRGER
jgi:hypothetical protein